MAEAQPAEELPYLSTTDLTFSKRNSRVTVVEADNKKNSRGYAFLIYSDHGDKKQSKAVVKAQDEQGDSLGSNCDTTQKKDIPTKAKEYQK